MKSSFQKSRGFNPWRGKFNRIKGVDWYVRLRGKEDPVKGFLPGLLDQVRSSDLSRGLIVSWELEQQAYAPGRCFALFSSYVEFLSFQEKVAVGDRCFYEVILGQREQKPHFDLDLGLEHFEPLSRLASLDGRLCETLPQLGELLVRCLMLASREVCRGQGVELSPERDFLLFGSAGESQQAGKTAGEEKVSYHLVLPRRHHRDNKEAKYFYRRVLESEVWGRMRAYQHLTAVIDGAVYSKTQQFRLAGSRKRGRNSQKNLIDPFPWGVGLGGAREEKIVYRPLEHPLNERHREMLLFSASLLTFTADSSPLPSFRSAAELEAESRKEFRRIQSGDFPPVNEGDIDRALALAAARMEYFPFDFLELRENCLLLRRKAPSSCPLCQGRVHEKENPYLMLVGEKVYWSCRRSVDRGFPSRYLLGSLEDSGLDPDSVSGPPPGATEVANVLPTPGLPAGEKKSPFSFFRLPEGYEFAPEGEDLGDSEISPESGENKPCPGDSEISPALGENKPCSGDSEILKERREAQPARSAGAGPAADNQQRIEGSTNKRAGNSTPSEKQSIFRAVDLSAKPQLSSAKIDARKLSVKSEAEKDTKGGRIQKLQEIQKMMESKRSEEEEILSALDKIAPAILESETAIRGVSQSDSLRVGKEKNKKGRKKTSQLLDEMECPV